MIAATNNSKIIRLILCLFGILLSVSASSQSNAWWIQVKRECGLPASLAYNDWVKQGAPCNKGTNYVAPAGPTPQELQRMKEEKDLKEAADDAVDKGNECYKKGDWYGAIRWYTDALAYDENSDDAKENLQKARANANAEASEQARKEGERQMQAARDNEINKENEKRKNDEAEKKKQDDLIASMPDKYKKYMREVDNIVVPPPSWEGMLGQQVEEIRLGQKGNKYLMLANNVLVTAFDIQVVPKTPQAAALVVGFKVLVTAAKSTIAAMDEAEVLVFRQNATYERILTLLKDKTRGPELLSAITSIKENKPPPPGVSEEIMKLARSSQSSTSDFSAVHFVMNAMLSKEAKGAFFETAKMEGMEMLNTGIRGIVGTSVQDRFKALRYANEQQRIGEKYIEENQTKNPWMTEIFKARVERIENQMKPFEAIPEATLSFISTYQEYNKIKKE